VKVCKQGALGSNEKNEIVIDQSKCIKCGQCVDACPASALEMKGSKKTVQEVFKELIKDRSYWGENGGVTISGGEPLVQFKEVKELLKMLNEQGVHTALDTSGLCSEQAIDEVFPYVSLFLYDLKVIDREKHIEFTGQPNDKILSNYRYLVERCKDTDKKIWIRTPIIPSATDSDDNIMQIANIIKDDNIEKWELCAFNNLCKDKYDRLYMNWAYAGKSLMTKERMEKLLQIAKDGGVKNAIWSGMTKLETEPKGG
jgi:pyruvate formate lyase activating enzyme